MIRICAQMAAACSDSASPSKTQALDNFAINIGLAFQVHDDILDIESDTATLGKQQGADQALNKPTYPKLIGLEGAREKAHQLHQEAQDALAPFGEQAQPLRELATYIISRSH